MSNLRFAAFAVLLTATLAAAAAAQATTGTANMSGTVSKFVEINSGGPVSLTGSVGGGVTTDGTVNNPLAVVINLGELGPSNTNTFVIADVPLKIRSNAAYAVTATAVVTSTATTNKLLASDVGFGLGAITRTGLGVAAGSDTNATAGDPTLAANGAINAGTGRFEFTQTRGNLSFFAAPTTALSGAQIMNPVPRSNVNGLLVPAVFAIKPQFYGNGSVTIAVTFTATTP